MYNGYTTLRGLQRLLRVHQPHRALCVYCYSHIYGATHASLSRSLTLTLLHTLTIQHYKVFASCIYAYATSWLFTYVALMERTLDYLQVQPPELAIYTIPVSASAESLINSAPIFLLFDYRFSKQSDLRPTGGTYSQQTPPSLLWVEICQSSILLTDSESVQR